MKKGGVATVERDSTITVSSNELYMNCSFNTVCLLPRFVSIKYSHQHLCRPMLITHHNSTGLMQKLPLPLTISQYMGGAMQLIVCSFHLMQTESVHFTMMHRVCQCLAHLQCMHWVTQVCVVKRTLNPRLLEIRVSLFAFMTLTYRHKSHLPIIH